MGKKILVLTGSPRIEGNTDIIAGAFITEAKKADHEIMRFDAGRHKLGGCIACQKCFTRGTACVFDDDFNTLAPMIEQAEVLVFAFPLYWYNMPAQIKAALDKVYSFAYAGKSIAVKEAALMVCAQTDSRADFNGVVETYKSICGYMGWEDKGRVLAGGLDEKGDALNSPYIKKAMELAAKI